MSRVGERLVPPDLFSMAMTSIDTANGSYPDGVPIGVCDLFEKLAIEVGRRGFRRYSARALIHRIRWHEQIERGNQEFKINNNITPALARWFIARHPDMADFFELRASPGGEN